MDELDFDSIVNLISPSKLLDMVWARQRARIAQLEKELCVLQKKYDDLLLEHINQTNRASLRTVQVALKGALSRLESSELRTMGYDVPETHVP